MHACKMCRVANGSFCTCGQSPSLLKFLLCRYKWGATPPEGHQCRIEEPLEGDVNSRKQQLRQQPFETVTDLLPDQIMYTVTDEDLSARLQRSF